MKYGAQYNLTPRRRASLRKAQIAAATRRKYGYTKHDLSRFVSKGIRLTANKGTFGATSKVVNFQEFLARKPKKKSKGH